MSKSDCLKKLYTKLTGKESKGESVCEILDEMIDAEELGGGVTSWDDLEGRPFYEEVTQCIIETIVQSEGYDDYAINIKEVIIPEDNVLSELVEGETYTVVYDGVPYKSVANKAENGGMAISFSGNGQCTYFSIDNSVKLNDLDSHTFEVYHTKITPIPTKFLPEQLQFGEEVKETFVHTFDGSTTIDYNEFLNVYSTYSGATLIVYTDDERYVGSWSGERLSFGPYHIYHELGNCFTNYPGEFSIYVAETIITPLNSKYIPKAEAIADVTDTPTAEQFNALLASLRAAGYLAE